MAVSKVTGYGMVGCGLSPNRATSHFILSVPLLILLVPGILFQGLKMPQRGDDVSPIHSAEVMNTHLTPAVLCLFIILFQLSLFVHALSLFNQITDPSIHQSWFTNLL
jgi:hypothetical protein